MRHASAYACVYTYACVASESQAFFLISTWLYVLHFVRMNLFYTDHQILKVMKAGFIVFLFQRIRMGLITIAQKETYTFSLLFVSGRLL